LVRDGEETKQGARGWLGVGLHQHVQKQVKTTIHVLKMREWRQKDHEVSPIEDDGNDGSLGCEKNLENIHCKKEDR